MNFKIQWFWLIPVLMFSLIVISPMLNADMLNSSEENTVRHLIRTEDHTSSDELRLSKIETIQSIAATSIQHAPAHYLQLSFWSDFVGLDHVMLRVVTVFYFLISVAFAYRLGNDLFDTRIAFFASMMIAISGFHMNYAHEIRMYSVVITQTIILVWVYWRLMLSSRSNRWYHWLLIVFMTAFGLYTHASILFVLASLGVYHLFFFPKTIMWLKLVVAEALGGLLFLPWVSILLAGVQESRELNIVTNIININQTPFELIANSVFILSNGFWIAGLLLVIVAFVKRPHKNTEFTYIAFTGTLLLLTLLVVNEAVGYIPYHRMRFILILLPFFAILWGYGLSIIYGYQRIIAWLILCGWVGMLGWFNQSDVLYQANNNEKDNFNNWFPYLDVSKVIDSQTDLQLIPLPFVVNYDPIMRKGDLDYYEFRYGIDIISLTNEIRDKDVELITKVNDSYPGFWLTYRQNDAQEMVEWQGREQVQTLFEGYSSCIEVDNNVDVQVVYYLIDNIPCDLITPSEQETVLFNNGYQLNNYIIEHEQSEIQISLWWENSEQIYDNAYGYSLQVFREGEKVGQTDYPIDNSITQNKIALSDVSAGIYDLYLIVYSSADAKSVGGQTDAGVIFDRDIVLGQFEITDTK